MEFQQTPRHVPECALSVLSSPAGDRILFCPSADPPLGMRVGSTRRALLLGCLTLAAVCAADDAAVEVDTYQPAEKELPWYEKHIAKVSDWCVEACTHILTERSVKKWTEAGCASFVGEHGKEIMEARSQALGHKSDGHGAEHLCREVEHALLKLGDDEIAHIPEKYPLRQYCSKRFSIDSSADDFFASIKHYFVLGERLNKSEL